MNYINFGVTISSGISRKKYIDAAKPFIPVRLEATSLVLTGNTSDFLITSVLVDDHEQLMSDDGVPAHILFGTNGMMLPIVRRSIVFEFMNRTAHPIELHAKLYKREIG